MTKIISLFNHKGGVSKTTITFHLAWKMANMGKKVLIVDADPQCNLTGLALGLENQEDLFAFYDSKRNTDIFNALAPTFAINSDAISLRNDRYPVTNTKNKNLSILAGNIRFSEIDIQIATALTSSNTIPVLREFVGAINKLIRTISKQNDFDIVIIDMSPSVSATNQCILMSSDYFIIPVSPDFYCYQAIDSLGKVLPRWNKDMKVFKGRDDNTLPKNSPKMLGLISQNYRVYTAGEIVTEEPSQKKMTAAYREWIDKIKICANDKLFPELEKENMLIEKEIFMSKVSYDKPYHLAGIQNFNTLIPVSQKVSKPIYELTQKDHSWSGAVWSRQNEDGKKYGAEESIKEADKVYTDLTNALLGMISG